MISIDDQLAALSPNRAIVPESDLPRQTRTQRQNGKPSASNSMDPTART